MNSMKIVFFVNILRQTRCIRRINDFVSRGYNVKVYGFDREGDNRAIPSFNYTCLGVISREQSYASRFLMMYKQISKVVKEEGTDCLYYIFSLDVAMATLFHIKPITYIYEISDLMELELSNKFVSRVLQKINRFILKRSQINVFTSEGFIRYYYKSSKLDKNLILPNKLNNKCLSLPAPKNHEFDENNIKFSFTGAIRNESIYRFVETIGKMRQHEVHLYGIFSDKLNWWELVEKYSNVYYHGPFKNPDDFPKIYSEVDIVVCYYFSFGNDVYLEPNKLYEAIFYEKPIVVSKDTFLGDKVSEINVGYVIDGTSEEKIIDFVRSITRIDYNQKVQSARNINKCDSVDNPEDLFNALNKLFPNLKKK